MGKNSSGNHQRSGSSAGGRDTYRVRKQRASGVEPDPKGNRAERRAAERQNRQKGN